MVTLKLKIRHKDRQIERDRQTDRKADRQIELAMLVPYLASYSRFCIFQCRVKHKMVTLELELDPAGWAF